MDLSIHALTPAILFLFGLRIIHSVMKQSISNFRLYCCSKKNQTLRKKVKLLLEQLQVCYLGLGAL